MKENSTTSWVVGIIVALVIGAFGGYALGMNKDNKASTNDTNMSMSEKSPNTVTKAADLRVQLNQQLRRHVTLATVALKDSATGAKEAKAASAALDANSIEISKSIGSIYGDKAEQDFLALWRKHIGFFVDYTKAKVDGDKSKMNEAKKNLEGYTEDASSFFENANPDNIDKEALKKGLQTHADQVIKIVDTYAAGNYDSSFATEKEAYDHIGKAADTLSQAIVKQFPNKF